MSINDQLRNSCSIRVCKDLKYLRTMILAANKIIYLDREALSEDDGNERYEALEHLMENIGDLVVSIERKINEYDGFAFTLPEMPCETNETLGGDAKLNAIDPTYEQC